MKAQLMAAFFLMSFINFSNATTHDKVIQGVETNNKSYPWQVSLQSRFGSHFCGGVLIQERVVLTAAHCVTSTDPDSIRVKGGSTKGELKRLKRLPRIKEIHIHPQFDSKKIVAHDIAILILKTDVRMNSYISPITLPSEKDFPINVQDQFSQLKGKMVITGWGKITAGGRLPIPSEQLMEGELRPLGSSSIDLNDLNLREYLNQTYDLDGDTLDYLMSNNSRTLLLEGKSKGTSPCGGDSGGPITYFDKSGAILLGISSYVAGGTGPCLAIAGASDVQSYLPWIKSFL